MLESIFILNQDGDVIIEKHYRGFQNRTVCDMFWNEMVKATSKEDVPPIIATPKSHLIHIFTNNIYFLGTVSMDAPPLMAIEFLYRTADVFADYFDGLSEQSLKDNFVTVYQVLDEMMDNGFPFTTEPNSLKEMIPPPSFIQSVTSSVTGQTMVATALPGGRLSNTPWRSSAVKYNNNEVYFDIVESIDCIIDSNGMMVTSEVSGEITSTCHLSDMPDLSLVFNYPRMMTDVSFHPCVRYAQWEQNRVISFVPPDGNYKLMDYRINATIQPPIYCKPQLHFSEGVGKVNVMVGPKNNSDKQIDEVKITIPFPKAVQTCNLTGSVGKVTYDEISRVCVWDIGKLPKNVSPTLQGTVTLQRGLKVPDSYPTLLIDFKISMFSVSGLKVESLAVHNVGYKPYKGVRCITKAGQFQVRTS